MTDSTAEEGRGIYDSQQRNTDDQSQHVNGDIYIFGYLIRIHEIGLY